MADHVTAERRSYIMSKVGQKDTKIELALRRALHRLGYRYRLHRRDLPDSPDTDRRAEPARDAGLPGGLRRGHGPAERSRAARGRSRLADGETPTSVPASSAASPRAPEPTT